MNKFLYITLAVAAMALMPSCMGVDNVDGPGGSIHGSIIDETTGALFECGHGENAVRMWEMSYSDANALHVTSQDLKIQRTGEYRNDKVFAATYDMLARSGPWWPCDTVYAVKIGSNTKQDFYITPYLHIVDFKAEVLNSETLHMECRLEATFPEGREIKGEMMEMPNVKEVRPFLSLNNFCDRNNMLSFYYTNKYRKGINKPFAKIASADDPHLSKDTYSFDLPVKPGYVYWVRMGACCADEFQAFVYSPAVKVEIPQAEAEAE